MFVACDGNACLLTLDLTKLSGDRHGLVGQQSRRPRVRYHAQTALRVGGERTSPSSASGDGAWSSSAAMFALFAHTVAVDSRTHPYFLLQSGSTGTPAVGDHGSSHL